MVLIIQCIAFSDFDDFSVVNLMIFVIQCIEFNALYGQKTDDDDGTDDETDGRTEDDDDGTDDGTDGQMTTTGHDGTDGDRIFIYI